MELLFICDRRNELFDFMGETVLNDLAFEVFAMLENGDRSDLTEQMMKAITNIREIYLDVKKREQYLSQKAKHNDIYSLRNQIESVKLSIECFPSEIRESNNVKEIINTLETIESAAKSYVMSCCGDDDDEQEMKSRFTDAEYGCGKDEKLKNHLITLGRINIFNFMDIRNTTC